MDHNMKLSRKTIISTLLAASALTASPVYAQSDSAEVEALKAEVSALKAQIAALAAKVDAVAAAPAPVAVASSAPVPQKKGGPEIKFKGAPEITTADGWIFKPRGRLQIDAASVNPSGIVAGNSLGTATKLRRAYLGVDGSIPGGFGYRVEADFAGSSVDLTDLYLTYKTGDTTITIGQQKPFWGFEEITSDLFTSFNERAAYHGAFGFERRVGLSAAYAAKDFLIQGGIFTDNAADLNNDSNNSRSFDGRIVFMPKLGDTQLHVGASGHFRKFNDLTTTTRYRARPFTRTTDLRLVDTRAFTATGERSFGLEGFVNHGRFHAQAEGHWMKANRPGVFADPSFFGGYAEVGYFLTGDTLGYKNGAVDRVKVAKPVGKGGMGAFQINARYDYLDLIDAGIIGGKQETLGLSLVWIPIDYVRFMANYGHLSFTDSPVLASGRNDYNADVIGLRAQIDF
jgi:phosphate-selective porin OprO and OprP